MKHKNILIALAVAVAAVVMALLIFLFPVNKTGHEAFLYIDSDDTADSVKAKMDTIVRPHGIFAYTMLASATDYDDHVKTGRYAIPRSIGMLQLFRHMQSKQQAPLRLTIPSVRTTERLAEELSQKMMMSKAELMAYFQNNDSCAIYGKDTATIVCLFIPNTYEVYWDMPASKFLDKMSKESQHFWQGNRQRKCESLGLTSDQVMTIASIIDEETANNGEKPMVAGMYYNRYQKKMPLQADPTIKFALGNFELRRIYHNMLDVQSPYNTYRNVGLPPGPIRIPSVAGIDAVLNLVHHDYLYMCAKEDFSGTHNFARTYPEHLQNAAKYSAALNARGIK